jgi:hypothetical protein
MKFRRLSPCRVPQYRWTEGWVGHSASLDAVAKRKIPALERLEFQWSRPQSSTILSYPVSPEPESQVSATDPYPEPTESTPPPANLPKIHSDTILPSTTRSSEWSLSFGLSHHNPIHFSLLSHACHVHRTPHSPWFYLPNDDLGMSTK